MHYHKPLMDAFRDTLGLGDTGALNFYKYSPQKECFVGFDQAYASSDLSEAEFFNQLQNAKEELVAELGAAFLCADLGLKLEDRTDHAAYIGSWLKVLKNDSKAIFAAGAHAQRASDYLHGLQ